MPSPTNTTVDQNKINLRLLAAVEELKKKNENPLVDSPLYPFKDAIEKLVQEGGSAAMIATLITNAGLETSTSAINRFIKLAKIRKKARRSSKAAKQSGTAGT